MYASVLEAPMEGCKVEVLHGRRDQDQGLSRVLTAAVGVAVIGDTVEARAPAATR